MIASKTHTITKFGGKRKPRLPDFVSVAVLSFFYQDDPNKTQDKPVCLQ